MAQVIYSPAAEYDLLDIAAYIARDNPDAASCWVQTIREKCRLLAEHPQMGEERLAYGVPGCRSFSIGSYVLFYRAIDDGIHIARVVHGSRDLRNL